jgi:hypothetical protein
MTPETQYTTPRLEIAIMNQAVPRTDWTWKDAFRVSKKTPSLLTFSVL